MCRMHGAKTSQAQNGIKRRRAQAKVLEAVNTYGLPRDVDPHVALLEEVHRTAGHVAYLALIVSQLQEDRLTQLGAYEVVKPSVWIDMYQSERKHLVAVTKAAIDAGIAERSVRIAEQQGALIADVFRKVLGDPELGITDEQRETMTHVVARHLRAVS